MPRAAPGSAVDLSKYVLVQTPKSTCPCGRDLFMLFPRGMTVRTMPIYYLCLCGRIVQAGRRAEIAPSEMPVVLHALATLQPEPDPPPTTPREHRPPARRHRRTT